MQRREIVLRRSVLLRSPATQAVLLRSPATQADAGRSLAGAPSLA